MSLVRVTSPALEPLTLAEVRAHLRLDDSNVEPAPAAPLADLASAGAGNVDDGVHKYCCTFVTADGETQGGDISEPVTVVDGGANGKVLLVLQLGGSAVTARKLYRTKAGEDVLYLVATINNNTATEYTDNIADAALGASVPTQNTTGDGELSRLIRTARAHAEARTNRALITQTWRLRQRFFPSHGYFRIPMPPLRSVESITYIDRISDVQTLAADQYTVETDAVPGLVLRAHNVRWPECLDTYLPVTINFTAGYGPAAADVPEELRQAMLLMIGDLYENRESTVGELPESSAYKSLIEMHRLPVVH